MRCLAIRTPSIRMTTPRIALVTVAAARALDEDLAPLDEALREAGAEVAIVDWDDAGFEWAGVDAAVVRSTWDYTDRPAEFLAWAAQVAQRTRLLNPQGVLRWNTDKHYLAELERDGIEIVPSVFVEPGQDARAALAAFVHRIEEPWFVIKPCIGAGSRDAQRHARGATAAALAHLERLLAAGRSALLQPYLERVDERGETALVYFDGEYSHAIRKGPLLRAGEDSTQALFATEDIRAREPHAAERGLAQAVLDALPFTPVPAYARVDLIEDRDGRPRLLELELAEPSLFFAHAPGSARRFAEVLLARVAA